MQRAKVDVPPLKEEFKTSSSNPNLFYPFRQVTPRVHGIYASSLWPGTSFFSCLCVFVYESTHVRFGVTGSLLVPFLHALPRSHPLIFAVKPSIFCLFSHRFFSHNSVPPQRRTTHDMAGSSFAALHRVVARRPFAMMETSPLLRDDRLIAAPLLAYAPLLWPTAFPFLY